MLPLLTSEKDGLAFHVVVPSLPNYAFSDGVGQPGFAPPQYAESLHKIMLKLGYDKYGKYLPLQRSTGERGRTGETPVLFPEKAGMLCPLPADAIFRRQ